MEILNAFFFFAIKKQKTRQALHEIIRVSSLSIIFVEFSFKPLYPTMVVKNFKFLENYNSWKMFLQVKILTLDIYTHMLPPPPPPSPPAPPPIPHITPAVTTLLQALSSPLRRE